MAKYHAKIMRQYRVSQAKDFLRDVAELGVNIIKKPYLTIPTLAVILSACSPKNTPTVQVDPADSATPIVQYDPSLTPTIEELVEATEEVYTPTFEATEMPTKTPTPKPTSTSTPTATPRTLESALLVYNYGGLGRSIWDLPEDYEPGKEYLLKTRYGNFQCDLVVYDGEGSTASLPPTPGDDKDPNAVLCTADYYSAGDWLLELFEGVVDKDGNIIEGGQEEDKVGEYEFTIGAAPAPTTPGGGGGSTTGGTTTGETTGGPVVGQVVGN